MCAVLVTKPAGEKDVTCEREGEGSEAMEAICETALSLPLPPCVPRLVGFFFFSLGLYDPP